MSRYLREPLLHFLVAGILLFVLALYRQHDGITGNTIIIDDGIRTSLSSLYRTQMGEYPTPDILDTLVDNYIRDEVLYREAMAMNLAQNDEIVRRRLIQKLEYLVNATAQTRVPEEAELLDWFRQHEDQFHLPALVSFRHLYFSPDRDSLESARHRANKSLALLTEGSGYPEQSEDLADPFMLQSSYLDMNLQSAKQLFGDTAFSEALFSASPGIWTGPLPSGYGWHLLSIEERTPSRLPDFASIRQQVLAAYREDLQAVQAADQYQQYSENYQIVKSYSHE